uniref:rRNA N-glycosidase n=1 Tax=Oryza glumipatula TaxID=40148 RepID=A0A0E0AYT1_9ORYZ
MAPKQASKQETKEPPESPVFELVLSDLQQSYQNVMEVEIPRELEALITKEAPITSQFSKVAGKLYTPRKGGTFLVKMRPTETSTPEETVSLLFRWEDLYFEAFHARGKWFKLKDAKESLPPRTQLPYPKKNGIYHLTRISTSYKDLGG